MCSVFSVGYKHERTDSLPRGHVSVTQVSARVSLSWLSSSIPSIRAEEHRPWPWGQQPYFGGFQMEIWSLFLPEPADTKIQSLPFCMCPPTTAVLKVWEKWRWEMFSMPSCCKSHWKANGSEPGGDQANENPARNGIHAYFFFFPCFLIWQNLEQL